MKNIIAPSIAFGMALTAGIYLAPEASAKAHNQGLTDTPGDMVGTETVGNSQNLGSALGNRPSDKGPSDSNPAVDRADGGNGGNSTSGSERGGGSGS